MRVSIRGEGIENPMHVIMDLESLPRRGDYISLGDSMFSRYVSAVVWELHPRKWSVDRQRWEPEHPRREPWTVVIETRMGRPDV